jgi:predicted type IV restriction endonuclease
MTTNTVTPAPAAATDPKWLQTAKDDTRKIRTFAVHARSMVERDANETDTRLLVTDVLTAVLGWDKYADISTEYQVRGEFADYALRLDGSVFAMVEVKRAAMRLTEKHLRQIEAYGLREGADWLILTNGVVWKVYRITMLASGGSQTEPVFSFDLDSITKSDLENLLTLHKQAAKRGYLDALWKRVSSMAPSNIGAVLQSDRVLNAIRLEVKAMHGYSATETEIRRAIDVLTGAV